MEQYLIRAIRDFKDGNLLPRTIKRGEKIPVDQRMYRMLCESDPEAWEVVGKILPKPTRRKSTKKK